MAVSTIHVPIMMRATAYRSSVVARCAPKPVFSHRADIRVSIREVEEAVEACEAGINLAQRDECYIIFGVDARQARRFLYTVKGLEDRMRNGHAPERGPDGMDGLRAHLMGVWIGKK